MAWTDAQWAMFVSVIRRGFVARDEFTADDANVYRLLLDDVEPDAAMRAVRALVLEGQEFRPRPGAIVERVRRDAGQPTFDEAYQLIFATGGILQARPVGALRYTSERDRLAQLNAAAADRAFDVHPLVGAFVSRQGIDRLRGLGVDDPEWGEKRRADLRVAWDQHVDAFDGREVAVLALPAGERGGLRRLNPLDALGVDRARPLLEHGTSA